MHSLKVQDGGRRHLECRNMVAISSLFDRSDLHQTKWTHLDFHIEHFYYSENA